jgi:ketosteroid isomerase-like protein
MSQENVELVKRGFDACNAGDSDACRAIYDPDVVVRTAEGWPEPGPYVGRDALMRWAERVRALEYFRHRADAMAAAGLGE